MAAARRQDGAHVLSEALFRAYFDDGRDVGDGDVLVDLASAAGLDQEQVAAALSSEELRSIIISVEAQAAEMQISGVPFFIVNKEAAVSGAQSVEQWVAMLKEQQNV